MGIEVAVLLISVAMQASAAEDAEDAEHARAASARQAREAQSKQTEVESQRARIAQVREARIRRAQVLASTGGNVGATSSGISGAMGSITTQAASNIGFINQTQTFSQMASAANQRAADAESNIFRAQQKGQMWQTIGDTFGASKADLTTIWNK